MAQEPGRPGDEDGGSRRRWKSSLGGALSYWLWRRWRGGGRSPSSPVRQKSMERGHEPENASESIGGIVGAAVLLVLSVAVVVVAVNAFLGLLAERPGGEGDPASEEPLAWMTERLTPGTPPKPRLQVEPAIDLQELHQREHRRLYTYGRIDSARLHMPIGRAMQLIARRGLPADSSAPDTTSADSIRVPTESGFRVVSRRFPGPPRSAPFLGSSPETYTPAPQFRRFLTEEGYLPRADSTR